MSYCSIITFDKGIVSGETEFSNAWGGAASIWSSLFDQYLKKSEYDTWLTNADALWKLAERADIVSTRRAVLISAFDLAIIKKDNFARFAADLRQFVSDYPPGEKVSHLLAWAEFIESCESDAVGFHGTSVSENPWFEYSDDDRIPYDLNTGDKHFEVYEYIAEQDAAELTLS